MGAGPRPARLVLTRSCRARRAVLNSTPTAATLLAHKRPNADWVTVRTNRSVAGCRARLVRARTARKAGGQPCLSEAQVRKAKLPVLTMRNRRPQRRLARLAKLTRTASALTVKRIAPSPLFDDTHHVLPSLLQDVRIAKFCCWRLTRSERGSTSSRQSEASLSGE